MRPDGEVDVEKAKLERALARALCLAARLGARIPEDLSEWAWERFHTDVGGDDSDVIREAIATRDNRGAGGDEP